MPFKFVCLSLGIGISLQLSAFTFSVVLTQSIQNARDSPSIQETRLELSFKNEKPDPELMASQ